MSSGGSVSHWIDQIKDGDHDGAQSLWQRYFQKMVRLARSGLQTNHRRMSDEEDVAISVFESFCKAAEKGRFPNLADRDTLWRLLVRMTSRKVIDQRRYQGRIRRGGGAVGGESAIANPGSEEYQSPMAEIIGNEPTPEFVSIMSEQVNLLLGHLDDPELQELAIGKMEGYSNDEMAGRLGCSLRTVERRLRLIREKCRQELM